VGGYLMSFFRNALLANFQKLMPFYSNAFLENFQKFELRLVFDPGSMNLTDF
jgi:hypothetical protein